MLTFGTPAAQYQLQRDRDLHRTQVGQCPICGRTPKFKGYAITCECGLSIKGENFGIIADWNSLTYRTLLDNQED